MSTEYYFNLLKNGNLILSLIKTNIKYAQIYFFAHFSLSFKIQNEMKYIIYNEKKCKSQQQKYHSNDTQVTH